MKERIGYILREEKVFVGVDDSKKTWSLCVRSGGVIVHETSMPAKYEVLRNYFHKKFPQCEIEVIYEAGFRGFGLHDQLVADGWQCVVTTHGDGRKGPAYKERPNGLPKAGQEPGK